MPDSNRPSGPGKPTAVRRDAATEREEIEETSAELFGDQGAEEADPTRAARAGERDSTTKSKERDAVSGTSGPRRG